ncbi:hypothetical protein M422DRAFT_260680 [Sphaerobolus stellatus SS14]|uniref:Uncharacterized protein n=1 Tax=Sphaerobolus stellatus (strain SS14) TaxID=990650 RepID=A0A0C9VGX3_SPHS4|nr:hypothetical protein M422DRAFT_55250 [Sphaerobolus stellatus SS14]KIJ36820.1 hypothetical protein M422DRAFT_260680 [Sphaerobolus stellatus SS14]
MSSFGGTLTGGIQDISSLLPLLGTEQCEDHLCSALEKGALYAGATSLSIFGSLGMARGGLKVFLAGLEISRWPLIGAKILADTGFATAGTNLPLIMLDIKSKAKRSLTETRLDTLLQELHIDDKMKINPHKNPKMNTWNLYMILITAVACLLNMAPYIYLNLKGSVQLDKSTQWLLPGLRAFGGFLTATMTQLVLQNRILILTRRRLVNRVTEEGKKNNKVSSTLSETRPENGKDVDRVDTLRSAEQGSSTTMATSTGQRQGHWLLSIHRLFGYRRYLNEVELGEEKSSAATVTPSNSIFDWVYLGLLLLGVCLLIVGYVGSFTVVQNARSSKGPLIWLAVEVSLSIIRMILWGSNPDWDDAPPLLFKLALSQCPPLPTCMQDVNEIKRTKILPLTRSSDFLSSITSFAGRVEGFDSPDVTLYYTLTRKLKLPADAPPKTRRQVGKRILYITIFDHKERTTRIYKSDGRKCKCKLYASGCNTPIVDLEHGLLEIPMGKRIDLDTDSVLKDEQLRRKLLDHSNSIMVAIHLHLGSEEHEETVENGWTLTLAKTTSQKDRLKRARDTEQSEWKLLNGIRKGESVEANGTDSRSAIDQQYLELGRLEGIRRDYVIVQQRNLDLAKNFFHDMDPQQDEDPKEVTAVADENMSNLLLRVEHFSYQMLLLDEVQKWEEILLCKLKAFLGTLKQANLYQETEDVLNGWCSNSWKRVNADIQALNASLISLRQKHDLYSTKLPITVQRAFEKLHFHCCQEWLTLKAPYETERKERDMYLREHPKLVDWHRFESLLGINETIFGTHRLRFWDHKGNDEYCRLYERVLERFEKQRGFTDVLKETLTEEGGSPAPMESIPYRAGWGTRRSRRDVTESSIQKTIDFYLEYTLVNPPDNSLKHLHGFAYPIDLPVYPE